MIEWSTFANDAWPGDTRPRERKTR